MSESEKGRGREFENFEPVDVTEKYLNSAPSELKDYLDSLKGKKVSLNLDYIDADPVGVKSFLMNSDARVTIRATEEQKAEHFELYPKSVNWVEID
ncbi:MAG: hypothetical protein KW793_04820 [Candidatus Doudnabacteria bacterium]|nr:hypothetical protein [Candidatus Doudnabacteria bacterium]